MTLKKKKLKFFIIIHLIIPEEIEFFFPNNYSKISWLDLTGPTWVVCIISCDQRHSQAGLISPKYPTLN